MALRTIVKAQKLCEFPGVEKLVLIDAIQAALSKINWEIKDEKKKIRVYYPEKCNLSQISGEKVVINISERNKIDMERLLREITELLQKKHDDPEACSHMAVNFRYGKHSVQFRSGHLERNEKDEMLPMHEVMTYNDKTMVRTLKTLRDTDVAQKLSDELDPYSFQDSDVAVGIFKEAKEALLEGGPRKEAAKKFGFKYLAKKSETIIPNGDEGQVCVAERLCVYSEELKKEDVVGKIIETYHMMKKVRNNPSVTMGLKSNIEIHADRKEITLLRQNTDSKTFSEFLAKLLEIAGVIDANALAFEYKTEVQVEDTPFQKWLAVQANRAAKFNYWAKRNDHSIASILIALSVPLFFAQLLGIGFSLFESAMIMVPAMSILAGAVYFSEKSSITRKVGQGPVIFLFYTAAILAELIAYKAFDTYLAILEIVAAIIAVIVIWAYAAIKTEDSRKKIAIESKKWLESKILKAEIKMEGLCRKALSNNTFVSMLTIILVIVGILTTIMIGIAMVPILILVAIFVPIMIFLDKRFWKEIEEDRQRTLDKAFKIYREKRENLPEACEVRFEIVKCKKLRNPFGGVPAKFAQYAKKKYPKSLTLGGLKATVTKLLTAKWAEKTLHIENMENSK